MKVNDLINNKYEIKEIITENKKGVVARCVNKYLNTSWIIKYVMYTGKQEANEVENLLKLSHRSIPVLVDVVKGHNGQYAIMNEIKGYTINDYIKSFRYTFNDVIQWLAELLEVLKHVHIQEIVHGDIKGSNIMIDDFKALYLIDFGSSFRDKDSKSFTKIFVAPERLLDHAPVDERSDIFSLGMVFHNILEDYQKKNKLIRSRKYWKFKRIIKRCLAISVKERYQSVHEVELDLSRLINKHR